ncbi:MAG: hypothetical protein HDR36_07650 [Treponema sp.]|nr:hypothetical protein [Treponema sp.]
MMKMSWSEIQKTYPNRWVGLKEVEFDGASVKRAIVVDSESSMDALTDKMLKGELIARYTTPNNVDCMPLGFVGMF